MGEYTNKTKGKIKQAVGKATGNPPLVREGVKDELVGKVQGAAADVKHAAASAVKAVKESTK
jgi:uncharacterized protein YjbJ (UPF0337 family)